MIIKEKKAEGDQPRLYMFGRPQYELQINTSEFAAWPGEKGYIDCHDIPCDEVVYNEKEM